MRHQADVSARRERTPVADRPTKLLAMAPLREIPTFVVALPRWASREPIQISQFFVGLDLLNRLNGWSKKSEGVSNGIKN
jgi:hypothetical protein